MPKNELITFENFGQFDTFDEEKGTYKALVATLDVVNANRRMLASGILGKNTPTVFVSGWNHSSGKDYYPPVAKAMLIEKDKAIYANIQHDLDNPESMISFKRNLFFKDVLQFSLGYVVEEYLINNEEEFIKVTQADFREMTPAVLGASPNTKVIDQGKELFLDTWLDNKLEKKEENEEENNEEKLEDIKTVDMLNELRRRKYDFSILTLKEG